LKSRFFKEPPDAHPYFCATHTIKILELFNYNNKYVLKIDLDWIEIIEGKDDD